MVPACAMGRTMASHGVNRTIQQRDFTAGSKEREEGKGGRRCVRRWYMIGYMQG